MRLLACSLALGIAAAAPAHARPPNAARPTQAEPQTEADKVGAAIGAWRSGDWARVRALLEPLLQDDHKLTDPLLEEAALRYLADATLQDPDLASISSELATGYINRLLASSADWRPPADTHGKQFYDLYNSLREQRDRSQQAQCMSERAACSAELDELKVKHVRLVGDHETLLRAYNNQEVEVREKIARNRAIALIPFGVGHFYNGRKGLGAAFLAAEALFGGAGLGLLIYRLGQCDRTAGFKAGSLVCQGDRDQILLRRNAEQAMGLIFVGTIALDIVLAQVLFRPYVTVSKGRVRRSDLDTGADEAQGGRRSRGRPPGAGAPSSRLRSRDILRAAPVPALLPGGAGLGVHIRF